MLLLAWCRYRLFRYSADGVDGPLSALPVLFLHGSSGDYHQARSLFSRLDLIHQTLSTPPSQRPDYFSVDFREEASALSGHLLLRQAHYTNEVLRTLAHRYATQAGQQWRGAVVVAHSMGGVVAHLLPLLCNHLNASVLAMYTLGAPHAAPVLVVDEDMRAVYRALAGERRKGRPGPGPVLLSLSGGVSDFFIEPALTFLPSPHTVNSLAHAVPHVQTAVEHQSLCWCRQVMEAVGHSITLLHTQPHGAHAARSLFLNPLHLTLAPVHRELATGSLSLQALEVAVSGKGRVVQLPVGGALLLLIEGKLLSASLCASAASGGEACEDVSGQVQPTSALYRDEAYPTSPHSPSARHVLYLPAVSATATSLRLLSSPTASDYPRTLPVAVPSPLSAAPLRFSALLPPGVYHWAALVPSGVDRYFSLTIDSSPSPPPSLFLHFSSVAVSDHAADGRRMEEDWFASEPRVSTVVRFHRQHYDRWATALLVVGGEKEGRVTVELSLSLYSYLRTLFLQLPLLAHFLLSAFLLLLALQHRHLRLYGSFPHLHELLLTLLHRPLVAIASLLCLSVWFIAAFPGTQLHASAFLSPSPVPSSSSHSLLSLLPHSTLLRAWNRNETGLAGVLIFLACLLLVAVLQALLFALLSAMAVVFAGLRRALSLCPCPPSLALGAAVVWLLGCLLAVLAFLCHLDLALQLHFGLSPSSSLSAAFHAVLAAPRQQLVAVFVKPQLAGSDDSIDDDSSPAVLTALVSTPSVSFHVVAVSTLYLLVQAGLWDGKRGSACAYQLSCSSLALLAPLLALPHLLTGSASSMAAPCAPLPLLCFPSCSPLVAVSGLQLALAFASTQPPVDSPLLQPLSFLLYSFSLLFLADASASLLSFSTLYTVLLLVHLPHVIHRMLVSVLDAAWSVEEARRTPDRTHVE